MINRKPALDDVEYCVLHLDAGIISAQIEKRGQEHEQDYVGDLSRIEKERDGYWEIAEKGNGGWRQIRCSQELSNILGGRI